MNDIIKEPILYIDDEQENLDGFMYTFRKEFTVYTAISAIKGLDVLRHNEIKVLITDNRMPGMTGVELLEHVVNEFPDVIRIILTGYTDTDSIIQAINKGRVYHYMTKPWNRAELQVILKNAVEAYNLRRENKNLIQTLQDANKFLQDAKHKAEESDLLKSSFLSNMSHEIRTPLNAIIGFVQFLTDENLTIEKRRYFIDIIQRSSSDLLHIIQDILDISRIEAGQIEISESEIHLPSLIKELFTIYTAHELFTQNPDIRFRYVIPDGVHQSIINSDNTRISQILSNLLMNAFKYTETGEVVFGYEVFEDNEKPQVRFFVKDTGIGIPADKFTYIFERFRKVESHKTKLFRGNGLGLTISKKLSELIGGRITLESEVGVGSVFYLTIPLKVPNVADDIILFEENIPEKEYFWDGKTILIVEDSETNFEFIKAILEDTNVEVLHASNGEEAVAFCRTFENIDLVLMDIQLPKRDGIQATKDILEFRPTLPIIAQTAYVMPEDEERAREAGCVDYITKPISKGKLLLKIDSVLS